MPVKGTGGRGIRIFVSAIGALFHKCFMISGQLFLSR
jgi:hypothetical protein